MSIVSIIIGFTLVISGVFSTYSGYSKLAIWKQLYSRDKLSIQEGIETNDIVQIRGEVKPTDSGTLTAPFSNDECVAYEYDVKRRTQGEMRDLDDGLEYVPFIIDDGTATAYVSPTKSDFSIDLGERVDVSRDDVPSEVHDNRSLNGKRTAREGTITVGEEATVIGSLTQHNKNTNMSAEITTDDGERIISNEPPTAASTPLLKKGVPMVFIGVLISLIGVAIIIP